MVRKSLGYLDWYYDEDEKSLVVLRGEEETRFSREDEAELLRLPDVPSEKQAEKLFDLMVSDIECNIDCFAEGEVNYDRLAGWIEDEVEE